MATVVKERVKTICEMDVSSERASKGIGARDRMKSEFSNFLRRTDQKSTEEWLEITLGFNGNLLCQQQRQRQAEMRSRSITQIDLLSHLISRQI